MVSQQCIFGQGKLVMVALIVTFILDNQLENAHTAKSILPNFS